MTKLKTYKQRTAAVMKKYAATRNNDMSLYAHYLYTYFPGKIDEDANGDAFIRLKDLKEMPTMENIRRSRQIIQNDDRKYLPTDPEVARERGMKEKDWRDKEVRDAKNHDVYGEQ